MPDQDLCPSLQQCQKKAARWPGTWRLAPQRAISLMPRTPSQILVVQGCAWITWPSTAGYPPAPEADRILSAGQSIDVPAGVHLVMESVNPGHAVDFDWRAMPADVQALSQPARPALSLLVHRWGQAWVQLGLASGQLLQGLVRHGLRGRSPSGPQGYGA